MKLPSDKEIIELHHKYSKDENQFNLIYNHSCAVRDIARDVIRNSKIEVNTQLVDIGCLLHDIGVYKLPDDWKSQPSGYLQHGHLGYELLKSEGFDEAICRFASNHTGVGISKQEIIKNNLPLPPKDYFAETKEERLVMYADDFHSKKDGGVFQTAQFYGDRLKKFGADKADTFWQMVDEFGEPNIDKLANEYEQSILSI